MSYWRHAKNSSVLESSGALRLAPLYDTSPEILWRHLYSSSLSMEIAGAQRLEQLTAKRWAQFARDSGLDEAWVVDRARTLQGQVAERMVEHFAAAGIGDHVRRRILGKNESRLRQQAKADRRAGASPAAGGSTRSEAGRSGMVHVRAQVRADGTAIAEHWRRRRASQG